MIFTSIKYPKGNERTHETIQIKAIIETQDFIFILVFNGLKMT